MTIDPGRPVSRGVHISASHVVPALRTATRCAGCFHSIPQQGLCDTCLRAPRILIALPIGTALRGGRYLFGRPLGMPGGFGITYHGWDGELQRPVAIKEFFPRQLVQRDAASGDVEPITVADGDVVQLQLAGFLSEARRAAAIEHPNVVRILDFTEAHGTGYIVMPYHEGETLASCRLRQADQRLSWNDALGVMLPILSALEAVHAQGLIHRDVKPWNIYLANEAHAMPHPILLDFGAARIANDARPLTAMLSAGYAPIEQYNLVDDVQGPWTDVYGAAATLYELCVGSAPPPAPIRQMGDGALDVRLQRPDIPAHIAIALEQALAILPSCRTRSAALFARALTGNHVVVPNDDQLRTASLRRARWKTVAIVGILVAGSAIAATTTRNARQRGSDSDTPRDTFDRGAMVSTDSPRVNQTEGGPDETNDSTPQTESTEDAARSRRQLQAGDYFGAWRTAVAAGDTTFVRTIIEACKAESMLTARRGLSLTCPSSRSERSGGAGEVRDVGNRS